MTTLILFCLIPILLGVMDTLDDKWMFYPTSVYRHIARFLTWLKIFKTQEDADFWFNSTGESWRNAYIDRIKDTSKPNNNKIMWKWFGIKISKPSPLIDAWHYFKWLLIIVLCVMVGINLPLWFIIYNEIISRIIYIFILGIIYFILFESIYNNK